MRALISALLLGLVVAAGPLPQAAHAQDTAINQNPECQRLWMQLAGPVASRMLYYVQAADQYPMLPNGRPMVQGAGMPPYPWAPNIWGPGGPSYNMVSSYIPVAARNVALTGAPFYPFSNATLPGGTPLGVPFVANQVVTAAGGIGAVAPGDLIGLADLRQSQIGNTLAAVDVRNNLVGTRLTAADFNLNYAAYPMNQAVAYREVLEGLDFFVRNACPRSPSEDSGGNGADRRS